MTRTSKNKGMERRANCGCNSGVVMDRRPNPGPDAGDPSWNKGFLSGAAVVATLVALAQTVMYVRERRSAPTA